MDIYLQTHMRGYPMWAPRQTNRGHARRNSGFGKLRAGCMHTSIATATDDEAEKETEEEDEKEEEKGEGVRG